MTGHKWSHCSPMDKNSMEMQGLRKLGTMKANTTSKQVTYSTTSECYLKVCFEIVGVSWRWCIFLVHIRAPTPFKAWMARLHEHCCCLSLGPQGYSLLTLTLMDTLNLMHHVSRQVPSKAHFLSFWTVPIHPQAGHNIIAPCTQLFVEITPWCISAVLKAKGEIDRRNN